METREIKICIMGASTSTNNRGVSALAVSLVKIFRHLSPGARLTFITSARDLQPQKIRIEDEELLLPTVAYRLSPKAPIQRHLFFIFTLALLQRFIPLRGLRKKVIRSNPVLREMYDADFVTDIQGGDSFSDIYGLPGFVLGTLTMLCVLLLRKKLVLLPQTYGPYESVTARVLSHLIIKNAYYCFSRDMEGMAFLQKIIKRKNSCSFCPDVAFMLDSIKPAQTRIDPALPDSTEPLVGINLNGLMFNGGYTRKNMFGLTIDYGELMLDIVKMMLEYDARVLLIPHTYGIAGNVNSDPQACEEIKRKINSDSLHVLRGEYNQSEVKGIIGICDFFIGSRMHACIAALSQCVPTVGIAYSKKFRGVFESVGAGEMVIDCRHSDFEEIKLTVSKLFSARSSLHWNDREKIDQIRKNILNTIGAVLRSAA